MDDFIQIAVLDNIIESQVILSVLEDLNIPFRIRSFHDTAYDGLFQTQKGWGAVLSTPENKDRIMSILKEVRASTVTKE